MIVSRQTTDVQKALRDILNALANQLRPEDNFWCKVIGPLATPTPDGTELAIQHNLGRTPINYIWNANEPVIIYDSRRSAWTSQVMYIKALGFDPTGGVSLSKPTLFDGGESASASAGSTPSGGASFYLIVF